MARRTQGPAVLVLNLNHGTLGVARSLGRLGIRVYAMGTDRRKAVSSSRYLRDTFSWTFRSAPDGASVDELMRVGELLGGRPILVPGTDDLALLVAENADRLERRFAFPRLPASLVASLIDKRALHRLARAHGIPTAETLAPSSVEEAEAMARDLAFPVMLKGIDGLRLQARTGVKMVRVDSAEELVARYRALADPAGPNLMIQEYIPGGDDSVWMFDGYFDRRSRCLFGITGRKIHQHPPHRGATSLGEVAENARVRDLTLRFAEAVGYRGILDVGFRYDRRDGSYKLLDPNPRIGCTFRLFVDRRGLDVARALYLDLTGRPVLPARPAEGRRWMVEDWEIDSARHYMRSGELTPVRWLRELRGVRELAWWAADDPLPALRRAWTYLPRLRRWIRHRLPGVGPRREEPEGAERSSDEERAPSPGAGDGQGQPALLHVDEERRAVG